ncbi:MAG: VOC family protein [Hasllibacter sp.]
MRQRAGPITPVCEDIGAGARFREATGRCRVDTPDGVVASGMIGMTVGPYPRVGLADDPGMPPGRPGTGMATDGHDMREKGGAAGMPAAAEAAGGRVVDPAQGAFRGGHRGFAADPDGRLREVAFVPCPPPGPRGGFRWNGHGAPDA